MSNTLRKDIPDLAESMNQTWIDTAMDEVRKNVADEEVLQLVRHSLRCAIRRGATTGYFSLRRGLR